MHFVHADFDPTRATTSIYENASFWISSYMLPSEGSGPKGIVPRYWKFSETHKQQWNRAAWFDMQQDLANQAEYLGIADCAIVDFATELSMPDQVINNNYIRARNLLSRWHKLLCE
jgi:hypothetical protein